MAQISFFLESDRKFTFLAWLYCDREIKAFKNKKNSTKITIKVSYSGLIAMSNRNTSYHQLLKTHEPRVIDINTIIKYTIITNLQHHQDQKPSEHHHHHHHHQQHHNHHHYLLHLHHHYLHHYHHITIIFIIDVIIVRSRHHYQQQTIQTPSATDLIVSIRNR